MENLKPIPYRDRLVVATNCLYRDYHTLQIGEPRTPSDTDGIRGDLALELFAKTIELGVRIVVCDGGSSAEFLSSVERFTDNGLAIVGSDTPGRGPQRRKAFKVASQLPEGEVILYTQPEKVSLVDYLTEISQPIIAGHVDIVIPKRNQQLFYQSYPDYMKESEIRVNATYNWLMKRADLMTSDQSIDWFFGPVAFRNGPRILNLFLKKYEIVGTVKSRINDAEPNPEKHSDGHYFPIIEALFNRIRVASIEIPFVYPPMQKANEESSERKPTFVKRRNENAATYCLEALHFLRLLQDNPRSQIREIPSIINY